LHLVGILFPHINDDAWSKPHQNCFICSQVPPYEPRIFPLPDDVYEKMLKAMPEGHPFPPYSMAPKKLFTKDNEMVICFCFLIRV